MRGHPVDDFFRFTVPLDQLGAHDCVWAFDFVTHRFADVVQQAGALGHAHVDAQFRGHQAHQMCDLDRVIEEVLRIAVAEMELAQQFHDSRVHGRQAGPRDRLLALAHDGFVHFLRHFRHDFVNARRVDASVLNQPNHRFTRDRAADRVEGGQQHGAGRIVNQHGHASRIFKRANIPSLASDDAAFDVVPIERDGGGGVFKCLIARVALNRHGDDFAGLFLGARLRVIENLAGEIAGVFERLLFDLFQELFAGLGGRKAGQ